MNPYSTRHPWSPEVLQAWESMPLHQGHIAPWTQQFRPLWQAWARKTPRHLWNPNMVEAYKELDRKRAKSVTTSHPETT